VNVVHVTEQLLGHRCQWVQVLHLIAHSPHNAFNYRSDPADATIVAVGREPDFSRRDRDVRAEALQPRIVIGVEAR
jgi:hypothetical protein